DHEDLRKRFRGHRARRLLPPHPGRAGTHRPRTRPDGTRGTLCALHTPDLPGHRPDGPPRRTRPRPPMNPPPAAPPRTPTPPHKGLKDVSSPPATSLEDVLPPAPLQQGLLFPALDDDQRLDVYTVQHVFEFDRPVDTNALRA